MRQVKAVIETLTFRPIGLTEANAYVDLVHRHHGSTTGHKFSVALEDEHGELRGVAIAGRPVARKLDNGRRLEVLRVATDGGTNACSMLYGSVARAAAAMGYLREDVITYTLCTEPGTSLRAAGWVPMHTSKEQGWSRPGRRRVDEHPTIPKIRWHATRPPEGWPK